MKVVKPMSLGVLFRPYTHRRRHRLAVTALGFFPLGGEAQAFLTENVQWPKVMAALPPGELLDAAMPKARGEVLLAGSAHAPQGETVTQMEVRLSVAGIDKRLRVIGDRRWSYGLLPLHQVSAPAPFSVMPLSYERAYGGPAYADNPIGQGYTGQRLGAFIGQNEGRMPNVEYPHQPIRSHCGDYAPAGFGALDLRWRQRQKKAGTYDARWAAESFPGLADDIDFAVFNAAPEDQQLPEFFAGGESYRLEGLHADRRVIEGRVPAMRVRAWAQRKGQSPRESDEIAMHMDTLWLMPEAELGVAIYRGTAEVTDSDALDVDALLLACERSAQAPRAAAWYRDAFALRLDPETAPAHAFNESQLTPEKTEEEQARIAAEDAAAEAQEAAVVEAKVQAAVAEFKARSGMEPPKELSERAPEPLLGPLPLAAIRRGDVDLGPVLARAKAVAEKAKAEGEALLAAASRLSPSPPPDVEQLKRQAERRAQLPGTAAAELAALPVEHGAETKRHAELEQARVSLPRLRREARRVAPAPQSAAPDPAVAEHLGELVRGWIRRGEPLAGRDLSGAALAGVDLRGADLRETVFERADLTGASLHGADLRGAVFTAATLQQADLSHTDLREANLSKVNARGACFDKANLASVMAMEADLSGARAKGADLTRFLGVRACLDGAVLDECDLTDALLTEASAERASLRGARLCRTVCYGMRMNHADLSGVHGERCVFTAVTAEGSVWRGAYLRDTHLGHGSCFAGADLRNIDAAQCGWRGADLSGADLREGILVESDLGECRFDDARLDGALLARAVLAGASLRACSAQKADLFQSLCRKADLGGADLREANLYGAVFMEAVLKDARLAGARHSKQREVIR